MEPITRHINLINSDLCEESWKDEDIRRDMDRKLNEILREYVKNHRDDFERREMISNIIALYLDKKISNDISFSLMKALKLKI